MAEYETTTADEAEYVADTILETEEMKKIFVGNVDPETKDEELKEFFETMSGGKVTDHVLIRKEGKKSNFGFVTFESSELIDEVLLKRSQLKLKNRDLEVNRAVPKNNNSTGAHEKSKKLFIANLPKTDCSEDDLRKYFEARHPKKFGTIESVQLIKKKDDQGNMTEENKGFGFVMVSSEDLADKMAIQHATFNFGGRKIELKKSVPTNEAGRGGRGGRGRGRGGRGGRGGMSQGGSPYGQYGGGYGAGYGGGWGDGYGGYGAQYDYSGGYAGAYGGGYSPSPRGGRFTPY